MCDQMLAPAHPNPITLTNFLSPHSHPAYIDEPPSPLLPTPLPVDLILFIEMSKDHFKQSKTIGQEVLSN